MTVRIRLARHGRKNRPFYRIVVADARMPRDGRHIEIVGTYNPIASSDGTKEVRFKSDRIKYWLSVGAQPSDRVGWLFGKFGLLPELPNRESQITNINKARRKEMEKEEEERKKEQVKTRAAEKKAKMDARGFCTSTMVEVHNAMVDSDCVELIDTKYIMMMVNMRLAPFIACHPQLK